MVTVTFFDSDCKQRRKARLIPRLGHIVEQSGPPPKPRPDFNLWPHHFKKRNLLMALTMTSSQETTCTIKAVDKKGNPARIDGVPEWLTDNSEVLVIEPSGDGLTCKVSAVGMVGVANVQVTADADTGAGVRPVIGTLEVSITAGPAERIDVEAAEPSEQS
jgi:hypothetical protein